MLAKQNLKPISGILMLLDFLHIFNCLFDGGGKDELKIEFNKFSPLSKIQYEENTNKVIEAAGKSNLEYFDNIKVYKQYAKLIWDFKNERIR